MTASNRVGHEYGRDQHLPAGKPGSGVDDQITNLPLLIIEVKPQCCQSRHRWREWSNLSCGLRFLVPDFSLISVEPHLNVEFWRIVLPDAGRSVDLPPSRSIIRVFTCSCPTPRVPHFRAVEV